MSKESQQPWSLTNVRIAAPDLGGYISESTIVIDHNGRIKEISDAAPTGTRCTDGRGYSAIPGLIDAHAHVVFGQSASNDAGTTLGIVRKAVSGLKSLEMGLNSGITSVRDAGGPEGVALALSALSGEHGIVGPRIFAAGEAITPRGGHGAGRIAHEVQGQEEIRRTVHAQLAGGASCIKIIASDGVGTNTVPGGVAQFNARDIRVVTEVAHSAGAHVLAHAISESAIGNAIDGGVDSIEHGIFLTEDQARRMKAANIRYCPTVNVYNRIVENTDHNYPDFMVERARPVLPHQEAAVRIAREYKLEFLAGSDCGNHGYLLGDLKSEIVRLHEFGLPIAEALAAATTNPANLLGMKGQLGVLRPGALADIILIDGDPLNDLSALSNVRCVIANGHLAVDRRP